MSSIAQSPRAGAHGKRGKWLRSWPVRALIAAALVASLLLGAAILVVDRLHTTPGDVIDRPASPVTDEQSEAQVVEASTQIIGVTGVRTASAGYTLMSCKNRYDPPYQGEVYLTFALPAGARADEYFAGLAGALTSHGWTPGLPPNDLPLGASFTRDAVTTIAYLQNEERGVGVLRVYGECRNMNNHRADTTAWIDVTDRLKAP